IPDLCGAAKPGVSIQHLLVAMPAGGVIVFADHGLMDMAEPQTYGVIVQNQTDVADPGSVAAADRLTTQITIVGPDAADVLDIVLIGPVKGQLH
ncbi:hypothetical protein RZS08_35910, partial [Arthrospira platensis SPKY1]|nr:hypothetical protein [Arthrospira platensis SPKY1]